MKTKRIFLIPAFSAFLILWTFSSLMLTAYGHEPTEESVHIIHVDENGFEPHTLTVRPGTKIIFENAGTEEHWPAADSHPSHTSYDGTTLEEHCSSEHASAFDSCGAISIGESWSFTFDKIGTFVYHDHLWPHLGGTIVVEVSPDSSVEHRSILGRAVDFIQRILKIVSSFFISPTEENLALNSGDTKNDFFVDLKHTYENMVVESDPRIAIHDLEEASEHDGGVSALCHDLLHAIGRTAYNKYGGFKEAAQFQSDFCNSGYVHGIFEAYFESAENPLSGLAEQCTEYASVGGRQFDLWQCHHGIGHGFMYLTGGDLTESLTLCADNLEEEASRSCQNGAFMEVFNLEVLAKESEYIDPTNPFDVCASQNTNKGECYVQVPTYLSQTQGMSFSDILKECDTAEFGYKGNCIYGTSGEAIKRNMDTPETVFALCKQAGLFFHQEICVSGIIEMYMSKKGSAFAAEEVCADAPSEYRDICITVRNNKEAFFR